MEEQVRLLKLVSYYEEAYKSTVKLIKAAPSTEIATSLFSNAKYYQIKIKSLREELKNV